MTNKLRMAVIGAGRLGGFHAQKIAARDDIELVAVVDPIEASRNRVAAACRTRAVADFRETLGSIDAAVIAAPTRLHHQLARQLLDAGVHLLVEKPICTSLDEADELVAIARRQGVVLQVGHVERFNPAFDAAMPQLGKPKYIEAVRTSGFTFRSTDVGVVLDMMIHDIDLVLALAPGRLRKVDALGVSVLGGHEDVANARLEFDCGCIATLSASRVSHEPVRRMQIWSGSAFAGIDFAARTATLVRPSETLLRRQFDVDLLSPEQVDYYREHFAGEHLPREQLQCDAVDALALELNDFCEAIRTPREPRVNGESGRDALAVAEEILSRIHAHTWDGAIEGPAGPLAIPRRHILPTPHVAPLPREKAG